MVWTNVFFFQFLGIRQKLAKENSGDLKSKKIPESACPRAPLEACSLGPSFRKSVSIYHRSALGKMLSSIKKNKTNFSSYLTNYKRA